MTVMLLSRQTLVSSRIGSWCSDWEWFRRVGRVGGGTYDVTHEEEDTEVVGLTQTLDALVDVLGVEAMVSQAEIRKHLFVGSGRDRIEDEPEKEDACRSTNLIVGQNVAKLLGDVADAFDDWIKTLTWIDDDRVS
jgi:hypothetical protein